MPHPDDRPPTTPDRAAKKLTGDCEVDCVDGCAYPGRFSECSLADESADYEADLRRDVEEQGMVDW